MARADLGNPDLNPSGALFYTIGIVATAVVLLLFFLGLSRWKMENKRAQRHMLLITQGFGILGAFAMLMSGLYPISSPALHGFFSACPRWLLILCAFTALVDMLSGVFHTVTVLEWITVALLLCSLGLLGVETNRLSSSRMHRSPTMAIR